MIPSALMGGRLAEHGLDHDAMCMQHVSNVQGVIDTGAEDQPAPAADAVLDDLGAGPADDLLDVGHCLQLALDELTAAPANPGDVDLRVGLLGRQRRQPAIADSFADAVGEDDVVEYLAVALVEAAAVEPVRRRSESSDPHVGIELAQVVKQAAIHPIGVVRHEVRFIGDDKVSFADCLGISEHTLNRGK
jgi:hypothetical protein